MIFASVILIVCMVSCPMGLLVLIGLIIGYIKINGSIIPNANMNIHAPHYPSTAESDRGPIDFRSYEFEQTGDNKFTSTKTGVTFSREGYSTWVADDDDGSGCYSEYYGWYNIED